MRVREVRDHIFELNIGFVNCHLIVSGEGTAVLVDTGMPGRADEIAAGMRECGVGMDQLSTIVLTHLHADHMGSAAELRRRSGAAVVAHEGDADMIEAGTPMRPVEPGPGMLTAVLYRFMPLFSPASCEPVPVDRRLTDRDPVDSSGTLRAVHTPGHTKGHIALLHVADGVLFTGDAVANFRGLREPLVWEEPARARDSIRLLAGLEFDTAVFGHGSAIVTDARHRLETFAALLPAM